MLNGLARVIVCRLSYFILFGKRILIVLALSKKMLFLCLGTFLGDEEATAFLHYLYKVAKVGEPSLSIHGEEIVDGIITIEEKLTTILLIQQVKIGGQGIEQLLSLRADGFVEFCVLWMLFEEHNGFGKGEGGFFSERKTLHDRLLVH
jgi:hypothetical protein